MTGRAGVSVSSNSRPEATLRLRLLPGCRACGGRHPLAIDPGVCPDHCLVCGRPMPPLGDEQTVRAVLTGARVAVARGLMAIGRWLARFASKG